MIRGELGLVGELVRIALAAGCGCADENTVDRVIVALSRELGGLELAIPKSAVRRQRDRELVERYRAGESVRSLARRFGLSMRQVRRIVRAGDADDLRHGSASDRGGAGGAGR